MNYNHWATSLANIKHQSLEFGSHIEVGGQLGSMRTKNVSLSCVPDTSFIEWLRLKVGFLELGYRNDANCLRVLGLSWRWNLSTIWSCYLLTKRKSVDLIFSVNVLKTENADFFSKFNLHVNLTVSICLTRRRCILKQRGSWTSFLLVRCINYNASEMANVVTSRSDSLTWW